MYFCVRKCPFYLCVEYGSIFNRLITASDHITFVRALRLDFYKPKLVAFGKKYIYPVSRKKAVFDLSINETFFRPGDTWVGQHMGLQSLMFFAFCRSAALLPITLGSIDCMVRICRRWWCIESLAEDLVPPAERVNVFRFSL